MPLLWASRSSVIKHLHTPWSHHLFLPPPPPATCRYHHHHYRGCKTIPSMGNPWNDRQDIFSEEAQLLASAKWHGYYSKRLNLCSLEDIVEINMTIRTALLEQANPRVSFSDITGGVDCVRALIQGLTKPKLAAAKRECISRVLQTAWKEVDGMAKDRSGAELYQYVAQDPSHPRLDPRLQAAVKRQCAALDAARHSWAAAFLDIGCALAKAFDRFANARKKGLAAYWAIFRSHDQSSARLDRWTSDAAARLAQLNAERDSALESLKRTNDAYEDALSSANNRAKSGVVAVLAAPPPPADLPSSLRASTEAWYRAKERALARRAELGPKRTAALEVQKAAAAEAEALEAEKTVLTLAKAESLADQKGAIEIAALLDRNRALQASATQAPKAGAKALEGEKLAEDTDRAPARALKDERRAPARAEAKALEDRSTTPLAPSSSSGRPQRANRQRYDAPFNPPFNPEHHKDLPSEPQRRNKATNSVRDVKGSVLPPFESGDTGRSFPPLPARTISGKRKEAPKSESKLSDHTPPSPKKAPKGGGEIGTESNRILKLFKSMRIGPPVSGSEPKRAHHGHKFLDVNPDIPLIAGELPSLPAHVRNPRKRPLRILDKRVGEQDPYGCLKNNHYIYRLVEWARGTLCFSENAAKYAIVLRKAHGRLKFNHGTEGKELLLENEGPPTAGESRLLKCPASLQCANRCLLKLLLWLSGYPKDSPRVCPRHIQSSSPAPTNRTSMDRYTSRKFHRYASTQQSGSHQAPLRAFLLCRTGCPKRRYSRAHGVADISNHRA